MFEKGHSRHPGGPVDQREVTIKYQLKPRNEPGGLHPIKNVSTEKNHNLNPEDFLIIFKDCRNARSSMRMVTPTFFVLGHSPMKIAQGGQFFALVLSMNSSALKSLSLWTPWPS